MSFTAQKQGAVWMLAGVLDENANLGVLNGTGEDLVINFKGVTRINSCGVRDWVQTLAKLQPKSLRYQECPMPIVKQLNAVPAFLSTAVVESIYAPYFCEPCDSDQLCLLTSEQFAQGTAPELPCPKCKAAMTFDAIPAQYLGFAKRLKT